jgi:hypothetical protein
LGEPGRKLLVLASHSQQFSAYGFGGIGGQVRDDFQLGENGPAQSPGAYGVLGAALLGEHSGEVLDHGGVGAPRCCKGSLEPVELVRDGHGPAGRLSGLPGGQQSPAGVQSGVQSSGDALTRPAASVLNVMQVTSMHVRLHSQPRQGHPRVGASPRRLRCEVRSFHPVLPLSPRSSPGQVATRREWQLFRFGATVSQ